MAARSGCAGMALGAWRGMTNEARIEHIKRRLAGITAAGRHAQRLDTRKKLQAEYRRLQRELERLQG